jgi:hypothetical protein
MLVKVGACSQPNGSSDRCKPTEAHKHHRETACQKNSDGEPHPDKEACRAKVLRHHAWRNTADLTGFEVENDEVAGQWRPGIRFAGGK